MEKKEKSFGQLLDEVINQAKTEAQKSSYTPKKEVHIDKSANIADEWSLNSGRHSQQQWNRK